MLCIRNLSLTAQGRPLITALSGEMLPGECWVIFGKNGAGKTTLLRTLAGLRQPDSGEILLDGRPLAGWDRLLLARKRAYLPQMRHDAFSCSVMQTVLAARHPYHEGHYWESASDLAAASLSMQQMDVLSLKDRDIRQLSGGERQRVALAAVCAQDTPLVLLDEPAVSLDLVHQAGLMRLAGKWCRKQGKSVMMVMHDLNLAHEVATHALLIKEGGAWQAGPVHEVMNAENLSACLGHAVIPFQHEGRTIFIPA